MLDRPIFFDRQGQPLDAARANELLVDIEYSRVALTEITSRTDESIKHRVSTVWLGANYQFGDGPPIIFETMVFGEGEEEMCQRYATEDQAKAGHAEIVATVAATVPDETVTDLDSWPQD